MKGVGRIRCSSPLSMAMDIAASQAARVFHDVGSPFSLPLLAVGGMKLSVSTMKFGPRRKGSRYILRGTMTRSNSLSPSSLENVHDGKSSRLSGGSPK